MIIQFNTDKTVSGKERGSTYFTDLIQNDLERFSSHVTRVEVHLSDENGKKEGHNRADLLKILHYTIIALACHDKNEK